MLKRLAVAPRKLINTGCRLFGKDALVLRWATEGIIAQNWGDKLNPYLASRISGREVIHRAEIYPVMRWPVHYWIGSHLSAACNDPQAIVWGAGFISSQDAVVANPAKVYAVRGWLSNEKLKKAGITPPDVVGDPALLLPRFFQPARKYPQRALGVIAHCFERTDPFFLKARQWGNARFIDICGDIEDVVEKIVSCDRIVSSSLHGIICADAYGIPSVWLHASDKPKGDGFKFRDYFSSVGREDRGPLFVSESTEIEEIEDQFADYRVTIDLDTLLSVCPCRSNS